MRRGVWQLSEVRAVGQMIDESRARAIVIVCWLIARFYGGASAFFGTNDKVV